MSFTFIAASKEYLSAVDRNVTSRLPLGKRTNREAANKIVSVGILLVALLGLGSHLLTVTVAVMYPIIMSFRALKDTEPANHEEDEQWLTYWVVYGVFIMTETCFSVLTSLIPFYFSFKLVFLVYLMHPMTKGALHIFQVIVDPVLSRYDRKIQEVADAASKVVSQAVDNVKETTGVSGSLISNVLKRAVAPEALSVDDNGDKDDSVIPGKKLQ
jgi:receptor expression-enhancing protein 5/6